MVDAAPKEVPFSLQQHYWRDPLILRRAPPEEHYDLRLNFPGRDLITFVLVQNPILVDVQSALLQTCPFKEWMDLSKMGLKWDEEKKAWYLPHENERKKMPAAERKKLPKGIEKANPRKQTPAWVWEIDRGRAKIFEDTDSFKKLQFEGKKLKGFWVLKTEDPGSELWKMERRGIPKLVERLISLRESIKGLNISGHALTEGKWKDVFYPAWVLEKAAPDFRGLQLRVHHGKKAGDVVGWVTKSWWDAKEKAIAYTALVFDEDEAARIMANHRLFNSPQMTVDYDQGLGEKVATKIHPVELTLTDDPASFQSRILRKEVRIMEGASLEDELVSLQRGQGRGQGGPLQGDGGTDTCICPKCGEKVPHVRSTPCAETKCPKCGTVMKGAETEEELQEVKFFVCPQCGHTEPAKAGVRAAEMKCPECGARLVGATEKGQIFLSARFAEEKSRIFQEEMQRRFGLDHLQLFSLEETYPVPSKSGVRVNAGDLEYVVLAPKGARHPYPSAYKNFGYYSKVEVGEKYPLPTYPHPLKVAAEFLDAVIVVSKGATNAPAKPLIPPEEGLKIDGLGIDYVVLLPKGWKGEYPKAEELAQEYPLPTKEAPMKVDGSSLGYIFLAPKGFKKD